MRRLQCSVSTLIDEMWNNKILVFHVVAILFLASVADAQDANCDFSTNVVAGTTYYIYNPGYPNPYRPGVQCRWMATCPSGYNCRIGCQLNIPQSSGCAMDRVLVSRTGDPQLASADPYCGYGSFTAVSVGQRISVGLISSTNSRGGTIYCTLDAQPATPNPSRCSCGARKSRRIVGGEDALPNEFPSMVALVERGSSSVMCGGVIISNTHVLTAAHCVQNKSSENLAVVVGEHDISTGTDSPGTRAYRVSKVKVHPQFSEVNYDYDIAIITVAENIEFNDYASPVCLPFKYANYNFAGEKLTVLGWGTLFIGGPTPNVLQKVDVDVISQDACRRVVSSLTSRQICTYTPGKDACQFDSGGPLLYTDRQTSLLFHAGIVSSGRLCASANQPGVNTRITELLNWIVQYAPSDYCTIRILGVFAYFIYVQGQQDGRCVFTQYVQQGQTYSINCPRYSACYAQCSWLLSCPSGYNCRLDCQINTPANQQCTRGQVLVSKTGDQTLRDAEWYCGQGTLTAVSKNQNIIISLLTPERVGSFSCDVVTQPVAPVSTCTCGVKKIRRIVNGQDTIPNEYPMMAGIVERGGSTIACGATIISKRYVVTAAHCLKGRQANNLAVVVGEHDISRGDDTSATRAYRVASFRIHPNYNENNYDFDIAILALPEDILLSENVMPVCLPFKFINYSFAGETVTMLGWGTIFIGGPKSDVLQKVDVKVISQSDCQQSVAGLTARQMCTYTPGRDACQFDSGGPVLFTDRQTSLLFLPGIISSGELCASRNKPGLNTRITQNILDWIVQTAPDDYCIK